ncbi:MAG: FprA family A-type flavoprotein [Clostridia bacterium]|nr:FprA family A-type flavoprotein [Clostridia bacterium]
MDQITVTDSVRYIGASDRTLDLFESQYIIPEGMAYNSYLILDDKIAVMDTADRIVSDQWFANLEEALCGRTPDYLVIHHMEPDHSANLLKLIETYPEIKVVGNAKTFTFAKQFFGADLSDRAVVVKEGDKLSLGAHELTFFMTPMVHWPEVMMSYDGKDKILFSADAFGKFGALDADEDWACEARRYYFNIVGKYGAQVQNVLKKAAALDIGIICPLHGPILKDDLAYHIGIYDTWSKYEPENKGIFIAYCSIHGNTRTAVEKFADMLRARGAEKVSVADLARDDQAECVEDAFRYDRLVVAAPSYDAGLFPPAEEFLAHLKAKNYQKRTVGLIENGSWAPSAGKVMKAAFEGMKNITLLEPLVSIRSSLHADSEAALESLADALTK